MIELWPVVASVVAVSIPLIGTTIGAFKGLDEMRLNREKRQEEFRWKQAELAKKVLDETWEVDGARNALVMLDWGDRSYIDHGRRTPRLSHDMIFRALGTAPRPYSEDEMFVRDSFDRLFEAASRTEHFVRIGLVHFEDVAPPWHYYASRAAERADVLEKFMQAYGYELALAFFRRFPAWLRQ